MKPLSRRTLLQSTAATVPLPLLDAMVPTPASAASKVAVPKRFVIIHSFLGFHGPEFIPKKTGKLTQLGKILEPWSDLTSKFSILSGLEHEEAGHGHAGVIAFTTGRHPARHGGRRSISADQRVAEMVGGDTRFDSLTLQAGGGVAQGLSWSRSGARRGAINEPGKAFDHLFTPRPAGKQKRYLSLQTSVLDSVLNESKTLNSQLGMADQAKFDEFQTSLRELELRATKQRQWINRPFPKPPGLRPTASGSIINSMPDFVDLIAMAFQTDSTRVVTLDLPGSNHVFSTLKGVTGGHHGLSHHGQRRDKINQLVIVEREIASQVKRLLEKLEATECEDGSSMLDNTVVLFGSGLGNASAHSTKDLPVLVAGGGFQHGQHHAYKGKNDVPFCNLYISIFKQLGIEDEQFGDSEGVLEGLV